MNKINLNRTSGNKSKVIKELNNIKEMNKEAYRKFQNSFWVMYKNWFTVDCIPVIRSISDKPFRSSFNNSFSWLTNWIKLDTNWKLLINVKDQNNDCFDLEIDEIENLNGVDYSCLDSDFSVNFTDWSNENFSDLKDVKDYIENELNWDLFVIRSVIETPYIDEVYLEGRSVEYIDSLRIDYYEIKNINTEDINKEFYNNAENYDFVWFQDSKIYDKYRKKHENDIEEIEHIFIEHSFFTTYKEYSIWYVLDTDWKQIILTELSDDWAITYDVNDIENIFAWIDAEEIKINILKDIKYMACKNELISKIAEIYNLESDYEVDRLRWVMNDYKVIQE